MTRRAVFTPSRLPTVLAAVLLSLLITPHATQAATVLSAQTVTVSSSTSDNAYYAAAQLNVNAPLPADLCAIGGTLMVSAPIGGDALLAGGTVDIEKPIAGDARLIGGRVDVNNTIGGDLMVAGGFVSISAKPKTSYIGGGTVQMTAGSDGPVTVYGADVYLSGEFNGDVQVVASDHVSLGEGTVIHGTLRYKAPVQADIPASAKVDTGVEYIGAASYLPTAQQAKTFAVAGFWVFIFVRIIAAVVATALVAGLFPILTNRIVEDSITRGPEKFILTTLLGFAAFVAAPALFLLLLISFVGIGIAFIIGTLYILFLLLSYVYSSVLAGAAVMKLIRKNSIATWRTAIIGVLVLYFVGFIPFIGTIIRIILCATAGGVLLSLFYQFAFNRKVRDINDF
jgi:hypothetical protein